MDESKRRASAPAVRFSAELARRICSRIASGESQVAICAEPGMPCRASLFRWARDRPKFAKDLARARAIAGRTAREGRPSTFCGATANEIFERLCEGESVAQICRDPAMPSYSTIYFWRRNFPEFAEAMRTAREVQAERLCDAGLEIAMGVTPEDAYATSVKLAQLRWTAGVLAPRSFGRLRPVEPAGPQDVREVLFRRFALEDGPDGRPQVVAYRPDPVAGCAVREPD